MNETSISANRKFKSSVFVALFENPDLLRELYCALEGVSLPPDAPVSINTGYLKKLTRRRGGRKDE